MIHYKYKRRSVVLNFRKDIAMELDTNNHSVFMLNYHLIMCVKYRNNVIDDAISLRLKEIFKNICLNYNISLEEWNHDKDHVHILFRGQPNSEISKFINAYKSASSRLIKKISRNQETFMEGYVLVTKLLFDIYRWGDRRYY